MKPTPRLIEYELWIGGVLLLAVLGVVILNPFFLPALAEFLAPYPE